MVKGRAEMSGGEDEFDCLLQHLNQMNRKREEVLHRIGWQGVEWVLARVSFNQVKKVKGNGEIGSGFRREVRPQ